MPTLAVKWSLSAQTGSGIVPCELAVLFFAMNPITAEAALPVNQVMAQRELVLYSSRFSKSVIVIDCSNGAFVSLGLRCKLSTN